MIGNETVDYGLRPIWDALLDIYNEFSRICNKYGLRYYGFAGTALGAVRHNGFIPWDDDMDVAMPRPDYEKFIGIVENELPSHLKFVNWRNTPELNLLAGKIQDSRKDVVKHIEEVTHKVLSNGVFIDIYPIDGYPIGWHRLWTQVRLLFLGPIKRFLTIEFKVQSYKGKCLWLMGALFSLAVPKMNTKRKVFEKYERLLLESGYDESNLVGDIGYSMSIFLHPPLHKDVWGDPILHKFDSIMIPLPAKVSEHLSNNYGNYMTLPPVEKRCPSHDSCCFHYPWWLGPTTGAKLGE